MSSGGVTGESTDIIKENCRTVFISSFCCTVLPKQSSQISVQSTTKYSKELKQ